MSVFSAAAVLAEKRIPLYGSGGWLSYSIDELIGEVTDYAQRGFRAVKIKVGSENWKTDLDRLKQVRSAVGDEVNIMIDANQGMQLPNAIQLARAAAGLNI
jgi:L-alanine-DL-glutamate epimerase-like enolase superfamily enzyme